MYNSDTHVFQLSFQLAAVVIFLRLGRSQSCWELKTNTGDLYPEITNRLPNVCGGLVESMQDVCAAGPGLIPQGNS